MLMPRPIRASVSGVSEATCSFRHATSPRNFTAEEDDHVVLLAIEDGELKIAVKWRGRYRLPHEALCAQARSAI